MEPNLRAPGPGIRSSPSTVGEAGRGSEARDELGTSATTAVPQRISRAITVDSQPCDPREADVSKFGNFSDGARLEQGPFEEPVSIVRFTGAVRFASRRWLAAAVSYTQDDQDTSSRCTLDRDRGWGRCCSTSFQRLHMRVPALVTLVMKHGLSMVLEIETNSDHWQGTARAYRRFSARDLPASRSQGFPLLSPEATRARRRRQHIRCIDERRHCARSAYPELQGTGPAAGHTETAAVMRPAW
jgi:hypothetical protein